METLFVLLTVAACGVWLFVRLRRAFSQAVKGRGPCGCACGGCGGCGASSEHPREGRR